MIKIYLTTIEHGTYNSLVNFQNESLKNALFEALQVGEYTYVCV